jgi:hypothetical protein
MNAPACDVVSGQEAAASVCIDCVDESLKLLNKDGDPLQIEHDDLISALGPVHFVLQIKVDVHSPRLIDCEHLISLVSVAVHDTIHWPTTRIVVGEAEIPKGPSSRSILNAACGLLTCWHTCAIVIALSRQFTTMVQVVIANCRNE